MTVEGLGPGVDLEHGLAAIGPVARNDGQADAAQAIDAPIASSSAADRQAMAMPLHVVAPSTTDDGADVGDDAREHQSTALT